MLKYPQGCKNNMRAVKEHIIVERTKQHEEEEEYTGIRPAGRENKGTKRNTRQKRNKTSKRDNKSH